MKNTIKTLYNIDTKTLIKYSDKVYKIKDNNNNDYCLKYVNNTCNKELFDKLNTLKLNDSFVLPIKTCIRSPLANKDNKTFYITPWVDDDLIESKDLKIKYYLKQVAKLHKTTSYTLNVTESFFKEVAMKIEEEIQDVYQSYESIIYNLERKEYKSPFQWYFINHFYLIINSLDSARNHLNNFKKLVKDKETIRQVINHLNFSSKPAPKDKRGAMFP